MRYFRTTVESLDGTEGEFLVEVESDEIVRQIQLFDGNIYWATPESEANERYPFTDQPESDPSEYDREIDRAEFERIWAAGGGPPGGFVSLP